VSVSLNCAVPAAGSFHHWTLSNPRAGTATKVGFLFTGPGGGSRSFGLAVPAGTVADDTLVMRVIVDAVGTESGSSSERTFNCTTGAIVSAAAFAGPPIPAGFVLRTITCDVAVYDTPGGRPVGDNKILAGQI
jgi:hypothetical protein